jgi:protein-S-isoprenylcysteine O-methyltransferase Ste14
MLVFAYGVAAYVTFVLTSLYAVGFVEGIAARSLDGASRTGESWLAAVLANTVLFGLLALQHTFMGRPVFRRAWARVLPTTVERSTHVLVSSLFLTHVLLRWKPIPLELWSLQLHPLGLALELASCVGWVIAFAATFQIDHLALFGVAQVLAHVRAEEREPARFELPYLYRWVRHPIYFGLLVALWCAPVMTVGHLLFATFVTVWAVILARLEERDLAREHREYGAYRARVPMLLPRTRPLRIQKRAG